MTRYELDPDPDPAGLFREVRQPSEPINAAPGPLLQAAVQRDRLKSNPGLCLGCSTGGCENTEHAEYWKRLRQLAAHGEIELRQNVAGTSLPKVETMAVPGKTTEKPSDVEQLAEVSKNLDTFARLMASGDFAELCVTVGRIKVLMRRPPSAPPTPQPAETASAWSPEGPLKAPRSFDILDEPDDPSAGERPTLADVQDGEP